MSAEDEPNQQERIHSPKDIINLIDWELKWCGGNSDDYITWLRGTYIGSDVYSVVERISPVAEEADAATLQFSKTKEAEEGFVCGGLLGLRIADELLGGDIDELLMEQMDLTADLDNVGDMGDDEFLEIMPYIVDNITYIARMGLISSSRYKQIIGKIEPGIMPRAKWEQSVGLGFGFVMYYTHKELLQRGAVGIDQIISQEVPPPDEFDEAIWETFGSNS